MKKNEFFPTVKLEGNRLTFNEEAIETMSIDAPNSRVVVIEVTDPDKKRFSKEILVVKVNGSSFDDPESIKDAVDPALVKVIQPIMSDGEVTGAYIDVSNECVESINNIFGKTKDEFKLLACNQDSALGKEFKEVFDISETYYRFAYLSDKRIAIGKEKIDKKNVEERISVSMSNGEIPFKEVSDVDFEEVPLRDPFISEERI